MRAASDVVLRVRRDDIRPGARRRLQPARWAGARSLTDYFVAADEIDSLT